MYLVSSIFRISAWILSCPGLFLFFILLRARCTPASITSEVAVSPYVWPVQRSFVKSASVYCLHSLQRSSRSRITFPRVFLSYEIDVPLREPVTSFIFLWKLNESYTSCIFSASSYSAIINCSRTSLILPLFFDLVWCIFLVVKGFSYCAVLP